MKDNERNVPLCYSITSGDSDYDNLYFFLINNMSFNYVWNLYRMIKEKLEELQNGSDTSE